MKVIHSRNVNDPLRDALAFYADDANWRQNGPLDPNSANFTGGPARAALAAAPQPAPEQGMTRAEVGQMLDTKRHDREVLVEVINAAMDGRELVDGEPWGAEAIADALLAAGWTRGGDAAGLRRDDAG